MKKKKKNTNRQHTAVFVSSPLHPPSLSCPHKHTSSRHSPRRSTRLPPSFRRRHSPHLHHASNQYSQTFLPPPQGLLLPLSHQIFIATKPLPSFTGIFTNTTLQLVIKMNTTPCTTLPHFHPLSHYSFLLQKPCL